MKTSDKNNFFVFFGIILILVITLTSLIFIFGKEDVKIQNCDSLNYQKTTANPIAKMDTTKGCIVLELYKSDAPKAVENFIGLAKKNYYNGVTFHRVIKDFMIQSGDPTGTGSGGESFFGSAFEDELNPETESYKTGYVKGVLAMANRGANTNTSQFFITVGDLNSDPNNANKQNVLQKNYTIFGRVLAGQDVADQISLVQVKANDQGEKSKPVTDVKINKVDITE